MSQISAVLIFGAPGSGKGTVGAKLAATTALKHLSTGDIFRGIAPSSESGKLLASYSSKGLLVPDEATVEIFGRFVEGLVNTNKLNPEKDTLLLDGIPRTVAQVDLIKPIVDVKHIFVLDIKDEATIVARLLNRAKIEGRKDDADENVIKNRLKVYKESTAKVLEKYDPKIISHIVGSLPRRAQGIRGLHEERLIRSLKFIQNAPCPAAGCFFCVGESYTKNL